MVLKLNSIPKRKDFLKLRERGLSAGRKGLVLQMAPSLIASKQNPASHRLGLTASKKIGNAVMRNRARRRLRALAHEIILEGKESLNQPASFRKLSFDQSYDFVLIARADTINRPWLKLKEDLNGAIHQILSKSKP